MAVEYKRTIQTWSGSAWVPATTGAYALRLSPFTTNTYVGSHVANGSWNFGAVGTGIYRMYYSADSWATSSQVASFGEFPINAGVQAKANEVEVSVGATVQEGILYNTIADAIGSFISPSQSNQGLVRVSGTGTATNYISLAHNDLVSFVNVTGSGKHIYLILGDEEESIAKTVIFSNMTIFMSQYDITLARTYTNFIFDNCDIYIYKDIELYDCKLNNCKIFNTGITVTISGTTEMTNCNLTGALTTSGLTGFYANTKDMINETYTMITDPLTP